MTQDKTAMDKAQNEEVSLKEIILSIQDFGKEVWRRKLWVIVSILIFASLSLFFAIREPVKFRGELTFMLDKENSNNLGGVSNLLGQFGLGGNATGGPNIFKILDLAKSRAIVQLALLEEVEIEEKKDYLANHIILEYDFHKDWEDSDSELNGFLFTHDSTEQFNVVENIALKKLHRLVTKGTSDNESLLNASFSEDSGIISMTTQTTSDDISIHLAEVLYQKLTQYYRDKTIGKQQRTYRLFKEKTDSIQRALNTAQYNLSKFEDFNRNLSLQQYEVKRRQLELDVQKLIIAYGESYKNLEVADFALKSQTPFIQLIDAPLHPLNIIRESKIKAIARGLLFGLFISIFVVVARKIIQDALRS